MVARCLDLATRHCTVPFRIPADGFYEWRHDGNRKVQVWIHLKTKELFAFAGALGLMAQRGAGDVLNTFTIITTEPNALPRPIHNRMPV